MDNRSTVAESKNANFGCFIAQLIFAMLVIVAVFAKLVFMCVYIH